MESHDQLASNKYCALRLDNGDYIEIFLLQIINKKA